MDNRIFNMRTNVHACDRTQGCTDTPKRVCTESWLWEKNPLPHRGIEPASVVCRSDALPTELHPHSISGFPQTVHSKICKLFTNFPELFFCKRQRPNLTDYIHILILFNLQHVIHCVIITVQKTNLSHFIIIIYTSQGMKLSSDSKSRNYWLFSLTAVKIYKLSKTSFEWFIFHRNSRPSKWQIIFPKTFKDFQRL